MLGCFNVLIIKEKGGGMLIYLCRDYNLVTLSMLGLKFYPFFYTYELFRPD